MMTAVMCLALTIWYECRECVEAERVQVAYTVIHRMEDRREFKGQKSVCEVVTAPKQFSFKRTSTPLKVYEARPSRATGIEGAAWEKALTLSEDVLMGRKHPTYHKTLHFHARNISPPDWAMRKQPMTKPDWLHVFYAP